MHIDKRNPQLYYSNGQKVDKPNDRHPKFITIYDYRELQERFEKLERKHAKLIERHAEVGFKYQEALDASNYAKILQSKQASQQKQVLAYSWVAEERKKFEAALYKKKYEGSKKIGERFEAKMAELNAASKLTATENKELYDYCFKDVQPTPAWPTLKDSVEFCAGIYDPIYFLGKIGIHKVTKIAHMLGVVAKDGGVIGIQFNESCTPVYDKIDEFDVQKFSIDNIVIVGCLAVANTIPTMVVGCYPTKVKAETSISNMKEAKEMATTYINELEEFGE